MLFQTLNFLYFFGIVFFTFHFAINKKHLKLAFLFLSSLVFYGFLDYRYVPILLFTSVLDFYIARGIQNQSSKSKRKFYLICSLVSNLGVLAVFKYSQFLTEAAYYFAGMISGKELQVPQLNIILPVGISFYTFQSMSYVIDVYRGQLVSQKHPLEFLTAVSFFPHLIAGPIVRASTLLNQFGDKFRTLNPTDFRNGLIMFAVGFFKKGLGDLLAKIADPFFDGSRSVNPYETWLAGLSFTGQIYADFSGYMDMAIGLALMLGFTLPESFFYPYLSRSPAEFWRRWNISLSLWFKDYLYIPLGGNRSHHIRNIMITMFLSGLWHGASLNFLVWGIYYGAMINAGNLAGKYILPLFRIVPIKIIRVVQITITFYLTVIGMTFFRMPHDITFDRAAGIIKNLFYFDITHGDIYWILFAVFIIVLTHVLDYFRKMFQARPLENDGPSWLFVGIILALGLTLNGASHAFIYFQM